MIWVYEFATMLRKSYLTFHRRVNARVHKSGVTADQFVVLTELLREEGITQVTIVERTGSDANTITALLRLMERRGLVRREVHEHDARRPLRLPDAGRAAGRSAGWHVKWNHCSSLSGIPSTTSPGGAARWTPSNSRAILQVSGPICLEERSDILSGDLPVDAAPAIFVRSRTGEATSRRMREMMNVDSAEAILARVPQVAWFSAADGGAVRDPARTRLPTISDPAAARFPVHWASGVGRGRTGRPRSGSRVVLLAATEDRSRNPGCSKQSGPPVGPIRWRRSSTG